MSIGNIIAKLNLLSGRHQNVRIFAARRGCFLGFFSPCSASHSHGSEDMQDKSSQNRRFEIVLHCNVTYYHWGDKEKAAAHTLSRGRHGPCRELRQKTAVPCDRPGSTRPSGHPGQDCCPTTTRRPTQRIQVTANNRHHNDSIVRYRQARDEVLDDLREVPDEAAKNISRPSSKSVIMSA